MTKKDLRNIISLNRFGKTLENGKLTAVDAEYSAYRGIV